MTKEFQFLINVMGAVRQTKADMWKKRPCVLAYRAYCDLLRQHVAAQNGGSLPGVPDGLNCWFTIAMPESWSEKKKALHERQPCKSKPDFDNLAKGVADALFENDQEIWFGRSEKRWGRVGAIKIELAYES